MTEPRETTEDQLDAIVDEFTERLRDGQHPQIDDYLARHPGLAGELGDLLSAVQMVEDVQADSVVAPAEMPALTGTQLGDYRIVREIGRGGMGVVYEAIEESLGRRVALKLLPITTTSRPDQLQRFKREARAAARLEHPNIVPVYGVGQHDTQHYIAMQYIVGQGLDRVIAELKDQASGTAARRLRAAPEAESPAGASSESGVDGQRRAGSTVRLAGDSTVSGGGSTEFYRNVARIGAEAAEALQYAHSQRVIHRDIKPSNLLLDVEGQAWVTDFGLAKLESDEDLTQTGDVVGTLRYMAPERLQGRVDASSDIYGLGLTLYELVTLQPAYSAADRASLVDKVAHGTPVPPRKLNDRIPRDLETIILKASAREPHQRYATADALAADLRRFTAGKPILARRTPWQEQAWLWCRRNPVVAGLAAGLAASLIIGLLAVSWNLYRLGIVNATLVQRNEDLKLANAAAEANAREAEERFRDALEAIDAFLTQVADRHLARTPGAQKLRAELLNSALRFYQDYITSHEDDEVVQTETVNAWLRVAQITDMIGAAEKALEAAQEGLPIAEELHRTSPSDESAVLLARAHMTIAAIQAKIGDSRTAMDSFDQTIQLMRSVTEDSDDPELRRLLAEALGSAGIHHRKQRELESAVALFEESIAIATDASAEVDDPEPYQQVIEKSWGNLGNALIDLNRFEAGLAAMDECRKLTEALLRRDPAHPGYQASLMTTVANQAVMYARQQDFDRALPLAERAVELGERIHAANPGVNEYKGDLAQHSITLAAIRSETGQPGAEEARERARELFEELLEDNPDVLRYQLNLAAVYNDSATHLAQNRDDDDLEQAVAWYRKSRAMADAVLERDPQNAMAVYLRQVVCGGLAGCYDRLGRYDDALAAIIHAVELAGRPDIRAKFRAEHAQILVHLGRPVEAVAVLEEMQSLPFTPKTHYNVAVAWAGLAALVREADAATDETPSLTYDDCAERAISSLQQAQEGGALDSERARRRIHEDADFDVLRDHPDFIALAESLEVP